MLGSEHVRLMGLRFKTCMNCVKSSQVCATAAAGTFSTATILTLAFHVCVYKKSLQLAACSTVATITTCSTTWLQKQPQVAAGAVGTAQCGSCHWAHYTAGARCLCLLFLLECCCYQITLLCGLCLACLSAAADPACQLLLSLPISWLCCTHAAPPLA
jgi:hypothetical protein